MPAVVPVTGGTGLSKTGLGEAALQSECCTLLQCLLQTWLC